MKTCDMHVSTSLDGPRELHNANRPNEYVDSYNAVVRGIELTRSILGHDQVSALMTTTRNSLQYATDIIDKYVQLGFESIFLRSINPYGLAVTSGESSSYSMQDWVSFYKRALDHIIELNAQGFPLREEYASILLRKMLTPFPIGYVDLQSPAGTGISGIAINYNGDVYMSDEARMLGETGDFSFRLGNVISDDYWSVITSERLTSLLKETIAEGVPVCSDCAFLPFCGVDPTGHYVRQGDPIGYKPTSEFCHKNMELCKYLLLILESGGEAGAILRSWATEITTC